MENAKQFYRTNVMELARGMRVIHTLNDYCGVITGIGKIDHVGIPINVRRDDGVNDTWYENVKPENANVKPDKPQQL